MVLHAIILAAGKGTRMKSSKVKIIHEAAGMPVINKVIKNLEEVNVESICMVVGFQSEDVQKVVQAGNVEYVIQKEQLGTGHAVIQTTDFFNNKNGEVIILAGDAPLISGKTLNELYLFHKNNNSKITVLSTKMPNPTGYGRIVRDQSEQVLKIVEHKDASETERMICEINTGVYCVDKNVLFDCLKKVTNENKQKEYYLTDIIKIAKEDNLPVFAYMADNYREFQGINSRRDLADVTAYIFSERNEKLMEAGVTLVDPDNTYIEHDVTIGQDTIIYPGVYIKGTTIIGDNCVIGANTYIENSTIPASTIIKPNQNIIYSK